MKISDSQIKQIAKLADLNLSESEIDQYRAQLDKILDYMQVLNEVDTSAVEPLFNPSVNINITRDDQKNNSFTQSQVVANGKAENGQFVSKGVFENE
jgi:aspartyl-tRNA(Asn)/glutamyl-tRNA(Gln) amidotransferase subunit C